MTAVHELTVLADFAALRDLGPWIRDTFPHADHGSIELALQELGVNIIEHAYNADGSPGAAGTASILVTASSDDGCGVTFTVTDEGAPPRDALTTRPDPNVPQVGGYGLLIIEQLATELSHQRLDGRNVWTLTFAPPNP